MRHRGAHRTRLRTPGVVMAKANRQARARSTNRSSYDAFKDYEGRRYTGMKIGRGHKWRYDEGDWIEKKLRLKNGRSGSRPSSADAATHPRARAFRRAPSTTGTCWPIRARASSTRTPTRPTWSATNSELAHKRADKGTWSASEKARRAHLIKILKQMIADLESGAASAGAPAAKAQTTATKPRPNGARARAGRRTKPKAAMKRRAANGRHLAAA